MARQIAQSSSLRAANPAQDDLGLPPSTQGRKLLQGVAAQDALASLFDEVFDEPPLKARIPGLVRSPRAHACLAADAPIASARADGERRQKPRGRRLEARQY